MSSVFLSVVMLLLLTFRVVPHHHHTLHLPESGVVIETFHFGVDVCEEEHEASHDSHDKCPSEYISYWTAACEELDYYKYTHSCDFSPAILSVEPELCLLSGSIVYSLPYINLKIPDYRLRVLSLRAPPYTVC